MEPLTLVWILLGIVLLLVFFKFISRLFSAALSVVGIVFLVWLVIAGLRYADERNLRNNLVASNSIFLLEDNSNLMTGFATDGSIIEPEKIPDFTNPDSDIYEDHYKVFIVEKEALPEKIGLVYDAAEEDDQISLFRNFVEKDILDSEDPAEILINKENEGLVEVHQKTMAFRHGIREVLGL